MKEFNISWTPTLLVLDATGREHHRVVGFVPSEFTAFRLQYAAEAPEAGDIVHEVFLQAVVSIGSHPAHAY